MVVVSRKESDRTTKVPLEQGSWLGYRLARTYTDTEHRAFTSLNDTSQLIAMSVSGLRTHGLLGPLSRGSGSEACALEPRCDMENRCDARARKSIVLMNETCCHFRPSHGCVMLRLQFNIVGEGREVDACSRVGRIPYRYPCPYLDWRMP